MDPTKTLTAAQNRDVQITFREDRTRSSVRTIPYSEIYRGFSAVIQTPVEHLQEAAQEDQAVDQ